VAAHNPPVDATAMTYSIFDSTGNLIDAFDDRAAAVAAMSAIVSDEPDAADDLFLIVQDEDGEIATEAPA
jgi:hypothetical protein